MKAYQCPNMSTSSSIHVIINCIISDMNDVLMTTVIHLAKAYIIAKVDYCNIILVERPRYQLDDIEYQVNQSILNIAAQIIYGHSHFDHITPILSDRLHWL